MSKARKGFLAAAFAVSLAVLVTEAYLAYLDETEWGSQDRLGNRSSDPQASRSSVSRVSADLLARMEQSVREGSEAYRD